MAKISCELCRHGALAALSHELRNPLAALSNSLYVLQRSKPGEAQAQRAISVMDRQIRHLVALLDGLTDAARLEQGAVELHLAHVDLGTVLRTAIASHEALFKSSEVQITEWIPSKPVLLLADPVYIEQIVGHLLRNAARFTPPGGWVRLSLEADDSAQAAHIRVQDSGAGFDSVLRDRLFEPFVQADTSLSRTLGGLGLGLAIVKGLVELHRGSVRAESDGPGKGSTFVVDLPMGKI
jgi:signal transduction histidine kinase